MVKKFVPVLLIILISLNTFGFEIILEYMLYSCKIEFREIDRQCIDDNEFTVFRYSKMDKSRLVFDKDEIKYNGHMYDIVRVEHEENDILYFCISDKKEDYINKVINKNNGRENSNSIIITLQKHLVKNYISPKKKMQNILADGSQFIFHINRFYKSIYSEVIPPPPDILSHRQQKV